MNGGRDPVRLRRYLHVLCLNTAGVVDARTIYESAGVNRKTALAYDRLLGNLLVADDVPAWWTNRAGRPGLLIIRRTRYPTACVGECAQSLITAFHTPRPTT